MIFSVTLDTRIRIYGQLLFLKSQNQEIPMNAYTFYAPSAYVCVCVCTHVYIYTHTHIQHSFLHKNFVCPTALKISNFTRLPVCNIHFMICVPCGKWCKSTHTHRMYQNNFTTMGERSLLLHGNTAT
jgi:hypothetical protein